MEEAIAKANEISPDGMITIIEDRRNFSMLKNFSLNMIKSVVPLL